MCGRGVGEWGWSVWWVVCVRHNESRVRVCTSLYGWEKCMREGYVWCGRAYSVCGLCLCVHTLTHKYERKPASATTQYTHSCHAHAYTREHTDPHTHINTHTNTRTHTEIPTNTPQFPHARHTFTRKDANTHTHTTHTHTHTRKHTNTYPH